MDDTTLAALRDVAATDRLLAEDHEIPAMLRALDGRFIRPAPGGDVLRTPAILPTGRNLHGFDPFRIPSAFAVADGARQAQKLLERHMIDGLPLPETVAIVLWGTDNLKNEGGPIAQALALMGALPRFDTYGRLAGTTLIPLAELGRPRIDVIATLSGIFRDLLPLQIKLLAEAAYMAAAADEPVEMNFLRKHALAHHGSQRLRSRDGVAACLRQCRGRLRVQRQPPDREQRLGRRGRAGRDLCAPQGLRLWPHRPAGPPGRSCCRACSPVSTSPTRTSTRSNSASPRSTTISIRWAASAAPCAAPRATAAPVYISDQTRGEGVVRSLSEQVSIETRTRMLNPKWYEGMLSHGYEGVRQIEEHVRNTMGWSATTGEVQPWVYQQLTQTFVLDPQMRERLSALNPTASAKMANRLIEAHERHYWTPDPEMLDALRQAGEELEDRVEGIGVEVAA